ncbi:DUF3182 family protein [Halopseudomonas nanhaiensis]|uniref:DUF3182 family protein n=1 Tax=Halopseudomonas nanhaiensis TaxID=2830842 RepID=UPI001CBA7278|nr:DUF3182 family protein [Halopseudomonas nanhaiensis]UAW99675.1 DUF3182 family protein [Halopseudomonas nanhaiensis]
MSDRAPTCVVLLPASETVPQHELSCHEAIGNTLARMMGIPFKSIHKLSQAERPYYIPSDTLNSLSDASALGIHSETDLFGGVVSVPYMSGKAIFHPLIAAPATRPPGWSDALHELAGDSVLPGYSAFCLADARMAAREMLASGPIRLKPVRAKAGRGQAVIRDESELEAALSQADEHELNTWGLVVERNLSDVETYSVGQVRAGGIVASYCGTQNLTPYATGQMVYGGSDLYIVRGDYDALIEADAAKPFRHAIVQARQYESAALQALPGLILSRRNYDVASGLDPHGVRVSGVLEQSWRIGGASGAEVAALAAFADDPALRYVEASTIERYGTGHAAPAGASVVYSGDDGENGFITKYIRTQAHERR